MISDLVEKEISPVPQTSQASKAGESAETKQHSSDMLQTISPDGVLTITLNRPEKKNAVNLEVRMIHLSTCSSYFISENFVWVGRITFYDRFRSVETSKLMATHATRHHWYGI